MNPLVRKTKKERLDFSNFDLPVHELRSGYRSAVYFWRTKRILEHDNLKAHITHQIFQKNERVQVCGADEAIQILRCATGYYENYERAQTVFDRLLGLKKQVNRQVQTRNERELRSLLDKRFELSLELDKLWIDKFDEIDVFALHDGDDLAAWETAMILHGDYSYFSHLESVYLGVLARRTKICTNSHAVVQAAQGKPVLFFTDRFDHFWLQDGDGYAAHLGGMSAVASNAMASWYGEKGMGTLPHAMIVAYGGDSVLAVEKFNHHYPEVNAIALVDFDNDCVTTALKCARQLGDKLWGVRLDTASNLVDLSLQTKDSANEELAGVSPRLVETVRTALDKEGFGHVKIIASGGFNPERISKFEKLDVPVDVYAVGSWILSGQYDFTADAVRLNGENLAKVGREYKPNDRLEKVV